MSALKNGRREEAMLYSFIDSTVTSLGRFTLLHTLAWDNAEFPNYSRVFSERILDPPELRPSAAS